jgi:hypothetical protein
MLKYSTFSVTSLNIYFARKVVILLLISGTLVTSIAVTGQTFATTIGKPDIGIDDGLTTEGEGAEDEEETDEGGDETTSERAVPSKDRFCKQGTGGDTGKPCIPCDPGLPIPGCLDVTTGEPLIQGEGDETESEEGGVMSTDIVEELMASNDTKKNLVTIYEDLENKGKVPPKTAETINSLFSEDTEESLNALGTLCKTASERENFDEGTIDCSVLETSGGEPSNETTTIESVWGDLGKILFGIVVNDLVKSYKESKGVVGTWCEVQEQAGNDPPKEICG